MKLKNIESFYIHRVELGKKRHTPNGIKKRSGLSKQQLGFHSARWIPSDILQRSHFSHCAPFCFSGGITSGWIRKIQKDATERDSDQDFCGRSPIRSQSDTNRNVLPIQACSCRFLFHLYLLTTLFLLYSCCIVINIAVLGNTGV